MPKTPSVTFIDNPVVKAATNPGQYVEITVSVDNVLESWRQSLFSYEWLDNNGHIKATENLPEKERHKRLDTQSLIDAGKPLVKPVLGIGILDNVEIGSGRAEFLTLAASGLKTIPVHIPKSNIDEFKSFVSKNKEQGNVLFYILIAIGLLAALSYAVSMSGRGNVQQLNDDKVKLYSAEVLEYANTVTSAVSQLRLRGCKETELSFENEIKSGYDNPNAPADGTCNIFSTKGGGVRWKTIANEIKGSHAALNAMAGDITIGGNVNMNNIGSDKADLILIVSVINKNICMKINELVHVKNDGSDPPEDSATGSITPFIGAYDDSTTAMFGSDGSATDGKRSACIRMEVANEDAYFFYKVLMSR